MSGPADAAHPPRRSIFLALLDALIIAVLPARGERRGGLRQGPWTVRAPRGRELDVTHYRDGRRHGRSTRRSLDGRLRWVGEYSEGQKTGEWFYFRRDGRLDGRRTGMYERGLRWSALRGFNDWNG